jgi:hypothetical protein
MKPSHERLITTDEGTFGWCNTEQDYKPIEDFQRNIRSATGYDYRCRTCNSKRQANPEYSPDDIKLAGKILGILGYETDPSYGKSVHQQFIDKHKL